MKKFKKLIILSCLFCVVTLQSNAQSVGYDSLFRPNKYAERVQKFKAEEVGKNEYIFLGNSITAGTDWSVLLGLPNAKQRGISGDITFGILERLQDVIDRKPAKIFILIGTNDISRNIPDEVILANYKKIIQRIREGSKKTQIYFYTILPVNASFAKFKNHYNKDEHILYLNSEIKKLKAKKVEIIDLYSHFLDKDNHLKSELTYDGLHLLPEGYQVWKTVLVNGNYLR